MLGSASDLNSPAWQGRIIEYLWYALGLAAVIALGMSNLFLPFGADQAVFLLGAKAIDQGATLYVDYWDNKQPALYYFWVLAGRLFGFTEFGIHLLELLYLLVFSVVLIFTLRSVLQHPWIAGLAPVATVGVYYATVGEHQLTQLEMLVSVPIYLALWFAYQGVTSRKKVALYFFLSGFCAGLVISFKLLVSGIVLSIWGIATIYAMARSAENRLGSILRCWVPAGLGGLLSVGIVLLFFWFSQALDELIWTALVYPSAAFDSAPIASKSRLVTAAAFYLSNFAPWLLFAGVATWGWWRNCSELLAPLTLTWLVTAALIIGIQNFSWWEYHSLLLFAPTGILAVMGIDRTVAFVTRLGGRAETLAMAASAVIGLPLAASLLGPFLDKARPLISQTLVQQHGLQAYQHAVSEHYRPLWRGTRFLVEPHAEPGPIYAFGHAMVYPFSGRECAHRIAGSAWEFYLPEQIQDILETLRTDAVPYVFVDRNDYKLAGMRPEVWSFLHTYYETHQEDDSGVWFRWREESLPPRDTR